MLRYRFETRVMSALHRTRIERHDNKGNATMIEFFFDCSSPWTYLAFHNIQPLAKEFGVEISWRPILVGGIFNYHQSQRLCLARGAGAAEGALP